MFLVKNGRFLSKIGKNGDFLVKLAKYGLFCKFLSCRLILLKLMCIEVNE